MYFKYLFKFGLLCTGHSHYAEAACSLSRSYIIIVNLYFLFSSLIDISALKQGYGAILYMVGII